jgi:hypothetical protein
VIDARPLPTRARRVPAWASVVGLLAPLAVVVSGAVGVGAAPAAAAAGPVPGQVAHPIGRVHLEDYEWFNILQVVDASNRVTRIIKIAGNPLIAKPPVCTTAGRIRTNWDYTLTWRLDYFTRMCASRGVGTHDIPVNRYSGRRSMNAADLGKPPFHGGPLSHGCLRMARADAIYVYDNLSDGVPVYFVETPYRPYTLRPTTGPPSPSSTVRGWARDGALLVTWSAAVPHGAAVTSYVVTLAPGGRRVVVGGGVLSTLVSGLTNGVGYSAQVVATSARGSSAPSRASVAVVPYGRPGPPGALVAKGGRNGSVALDWTPAAANGSPVTYRLAVSGGPTLTLRRRRLRRRPRAAARPAAPADARSRQRGRDRTRADGRAVPAALTRACTRPA